MSASDVFNIAGMIVAERYALGPAVGESSYAVVYQATHVASSERRALQVFKVLGEYGEDARRRLLAAFVEQADRLRRLAPDISAIRAPRDIGPLTTHGGKWVPFMAFDWFDGTTLEATLANERGLRAAPRDLRSAMSLLDPIATALEVLHAHGLAHLDVKPGNVLVSPPTFDSATISVRLMDFGTAHLVSSAQIDGEAGGVSIASRYFEPAYAASEQFVSPGPPRGPWTDVFSLALVLTEMITGRPVARNADVGSLATAPRPTPRMLGAEVPDEVEAVFARALAVDPRQRYATAGEFWRALRAALEESATRLPPPSRPRPSERVRDKITTSPDLARERLEAVELSQRSPRLVIVSVTLLLVGIAMGLMCTHSGSTPRQNPAPTPSVQGHP